MKPDYQRHIQAYSANSTENAKYLKKLKGLKTAVLDELFHSAHERVFRKTDCLQCANCCKTTSPIFRGVDIQRLSKALKVKTAFFIDCFLQLDDEGDYVLKEAPCPFLLPDNRCSVYESRPLACREYPHTNRKKMNQILDLTHKNALICPAVADMVEQIKMRG
jgi:Fe-S-cluster containining protein